MWSAVCVRSLLEDVERLEDDNEEEDEDDEPWIVLRRVGAGGFLIPADVLIERSGCSQCV